MQELVYNNRLIRNEKDEFWNCIRDCIARDVVLTEDLLTSLEKDINGKTNYTSEDDPVFEYAYFAKPLPVPDDLLKYDDSQLYFFGDSFCLKAQVYNKLEKLEKRNLELVARLVSMDLEMRLGKDFKGVYPYAGLDIDLPLMLGGEWQIIEPTYTDADYLSRIRSFTKYGGEALDRNKLSITHSPILNQSRLAAEITAFKPDVVLIKEPGPQVSYDDLLGFYRRFIDEETIIVSNDKLRYEGLKSIDCLLNIEGLSKIHAEFVTYSIGGMLMYPCHDLQMYTLKPRK
jgi:hypothetical protein